MPKNIHEIFLNEDNKNENLWVGGNPEINIKSYYIITILKDRLLKNKSVKHNKISINRYPSIHENSTYNTSRLFFNVVKRKIV